MLEITPESIANVKQRSFEKRCKVSPRGEGKFYLRCVNPEHTGGHTLRFERRTDNSLWGECWLNDTGEVCPAALGKRICYHLSSALPLFLTMEAGAHGRTLPDDRDGAIEVAVLLDGPLNATLPEPIPTPAPRPVYWKGSDGLTRPQGQPIPVW